MDLTSTVHNDRNTLISLSLSILLGNIQRSNSNRESISVEVDTRTFQMV